MAEVNIIQETIDRHNNEDLIIYLSKLMNGVVRNFRTGVEKNNTAVLWATTGDIAQCAAILKAMSDKIKERQVANPN